MIKRVSVLTALALVATTTAVSAAKKPTKPFTNPLSISPTRLHPGGMLHINGTRFQTSKKVQITIWCPMLTSKGKPKATIVAHANAKGVFHTTYKIPALHGKTQRKQCNVYALNTRGKTGAFDSEGFTIIR